MVEQAELRPEWWSLLDPQVAELLDDLDRLGLKRTEEMTPGEARAQWRGDDGEPRSGIGLLGVSDAIMPGPAGPLGLRVYRPEAADPPLLVFFHGGGFCIDSIDTHDGLCRSIARMTPCTVVSVDYRLAPEDPFPAAVEDAVAALRWSLEHGASLGADASRCAVGGDSAGGNLATVAVRRLCQAGGIDATAIRMQWLAYPVVDWRDMQRPSYRQFGDCRALTVGEMRWYRRHYLPNAADIHKVDASPLLCDDLDGLPPAFVMSAEVDILRDEAQAYAEKLQASGVEVLYRCYPGMVHAFLGMIGMVDAADAALMDAVRELRRSLQSA